MFARSKRTPLGRRRRSVTVFRDTHLFVNGRLLTISSWAADDSGGSASPAKVWVAANSETILPLLSVSIAWNGVPSDGGSNVLCVGQQVTSCARNPRALPAGVSTNGLTTAAPRTVTGRKA